MILKSLIVFGAVFLVTGILTAYYWPVLFGIFVQPQLALSAASLSYGMWKETPVPLYMDFYFFNWENPVESLAGREKPKFTERGPYVFREFHTKEVSSWNGNDTVTFRQVRKWIFMKDMSKNLTLDDRITTVNPITFTLSKMLKTMDVCRLKQDAIEAAMLFEGENMYMRRPVRELLFEGYTDKILEILDESPIKPLPNPLGSTHFGWFYPHNMSAKFDGVSNMDTGTGNLDGLGILKSWNFESYTKYFKGECGKVKGSTGEIWPLNAAKWDSATLFITDLCSSLDLVNSGEQDSLHGLTGTTFVGGENVFDNGTLYPGNKCYLDPGTTLRTGVRSLSSCRFGAPAVVSFPHFYLADPAYVDAVQGLSPSEDKHQTKVTLEQNTGIPLAVNARLQLSIQSSPTNCYIDMFKNLPEVTLPALWLEQRMVVTSKLSWVVWWASMSVTRITYLFIGVAIFGGLLFVSGWILVFCHLYRHHRRKLDRLPILEDIDELSD